MGKLFCEFTQHGRATKVVIYNRERYWLKEYLDDDAATLAMGGVGLAEQKADMGNPPFGQTMRLRKYLFAVPANFDLDLLEQHGFVMTALA